MALPPGLTPKTVTIGAGIFFDGTTVAGRATITAPVNVVHTPTGQPIYSSSMTKPLVDGSVTFDLCPNDAPGLNRVDWTYKLVVEVTGATTQPYPIYFPLPNDGPDVLDLDGLVSVPSSAGIPVSVDVLTSDRLPAQMAAVAAGDNEFSAAQSAAYGRAPDVHTDFRTQPNGTPAAGDEGLPVDLNPDSGLGLMTVSGGRLVSSIDGVTAKASYWQQDVGEEVRRIGGEFTFGAGTANGAVTFALWEHVIPDPYAVPDSPLHFVVGPTVWTYGVCEGGSVVQIASGEFVTPLAQDDTTVHRAEARRDGDTATLLLPDGSTATVTDPRIASIPGPVATFELYKNTATDAATAFTRIWADTDTAPIGGTTPSEVARLLAANIPVGAPRGVSYVGADLTVPAAATDIAPELAVIAVVPDSGKLAVELSSWLEVAAAGFVFWVLINGATNVVFRTVARQPAHSGLITLRHVIEDRTPGEVLVLRWQHYTTAPDPGTYLRLQAGQGDGAHMTVTPVL